MSEDLIIKFFDKQSVYSEEEGTHLGLVVDTETTGLESDAEVIEICILPFKFTDDLKITKVFKPYVGFEEPSNPLSDKIKSLTNLTDEELAGQHFDDGKITSLFNSAEIVIAHNASFDRPKMEKRFPTLKKIPWGCSVKDPDWDSLNIASRALDYIAFRLGFYFDHHRAENDCRATLHILSFDLPTKMTAFESLISKAFNPEIKLFAKTKIEFKDLLKGRGWHWDFNKKQWFTSGDEKFLANERKFVEERIPSAELTEEVSDIKKRYA